MLADIIEHGRRSKRSLTAFAIMIVLAIALWLMFVRYV
jgi:hypothetical protein